MEEEKERNSFAAQGENEENQNRRLSGSKRKAPVLSASSSASSSSSSSPSSSSSCVLPYAASFAFLDHMLAVTVDFLLVCPDQVGTYEKGGGGGASNQGCIQVSRQTACRVVSRQTAYKVVSRQTAATVGDGCMPCLYIQNTGTSLLGGTIHTAFQYFSGVCFMDGACQGKRGTKHPCYSPVPPPHPHHSRRLLFPVVVVRDFFRVCGGLVGALRRVQDGVSLPQSHR